MVDDKMNTRQVSGYKRQIHEQMRFFKMGATGTGDNNFDLQADAIENIKSDIKEKMVSNGLTEDLKKIEDIVFWYRTLEQRYVKATPDGPKIVFPGNIKVKVNQNLRAAYEIEIKSLGKLGLLE